MADRGRFLIGGILLFVALAYFGYLAFQGATVYYITVNELLSQEAPGSDGTLRVNGDLLPESFQREPGSTLARFTLVDPNTNQRMDTIYAGVVPDLFFNEHSQIVAEGLYGSDGIFHADLIIVKCPSKFASSVEST